MDAAEFVDALVGHLLSWQVFGVFTVVLFRKPIGSLIGDIVKLKGPAGVEVELERERKWSAIARGALAGAMTPHPSELPALEAGQDPPLEERGPQLLKLGNEYIAASPGNAVVVVFNQLRQDIANLVSFDSRASPGGIREFHSWPTARIAQRALEQNLITPQMAEAIQALDRLHALASETPDKVTRQQAEEFLTIVDGLFRGIDLVRDLKRRAYQDEISSASVPPVP